MTQPLVEVKHLKKFFPIKGGIFRTTVAEVKALDDISFSIYPAQTLGIVGESGCGKSTLGRAILRLQDASSGEVYFSGQDIYGMSPDDLLKLRRKMQIIFQDPFASLNPRSTVFEIIVEPLQIHKIGDDRSRRERVKELLELVGLRVEAMHRYPHEFSGGQRQRIGIARALALEPQLIVADEPVSALDVSVQSQVLNLIKDLQEKFGISFLFIAHDLAVVQHISHEVGVMYLGKLVEKAKTEHLYQNPLHPYTQSLLSAIPKPNPRAKRERIILKGDVPSPINPPSGCRFHTRCPKAMAICQQKEPMLQQRDDDQHLVACHLYDQH